MKISEGSGAELHWITLNEKKEKWFDCKLNLIDFSIEKTSDPEKAAIIQNLIKTAARLNSDFLSKWKKYKITNQLEFSTDWGWGSSSTLIANIAEWAEISPFELFFETQTGSGYDVAAAIADGPILYQKTEDELSFEEIEMNPVLLSNSFVFYRGNKTSSQEAVSRWQSQKRWKRDDIELISRITENIAGNCALPDTIAGIREHEKVISRILDTPFLQNDYHDYEGVIKSLGAWGGDFALALHEDIQYTEKFLQANKLSPYFRLSDLVLFR